MPTITGGALPAAISHVKFRSCGSGAFQADAGLLAKIPDSQSFTQAAVLPLGLSIAAAMFRKDTMALLLPGAPSAAQNKDKHGKKKVLIWGGRTSVGSCAIQLAAMAGFDMVTTASARNQYYC
ncbi:hypothetical protein PG984_009088 [Apiospora sp. TS-2023a]